VHKEQTSALLSQLRQFETLHATHALVVAKASYLNVLIHLLHVNLSAQTAQFLIHGSQVLVVVP
jgi:hypothetical protein